MSRVANKFEGRKKVKGESPLLKPLMILGMVLVGLFSFAALIVLMGYGDELRQKENGGATPISQSAIGYAGYVQLLGDVGFDVQTDTKPYKSDWQSRDRLRVYTPPSNFMGGKLEGLASDAPKLIVIPKWMVTPLKDKTGWVRKHWAGDFMRATQLDLIIGSTGKNIYVHQLDEDDTAESFDIELSSVPVIVTEVNMEGLQYFSPMLPKPVIKDDENEDGTEKSDGNETLEKVVDIVKKVTGDKILKLDSIISGPNGEAVLIKLPDSRTYVLSDPDFINTQGLSKQSRARLSVDILETIIRLEELDPSAVTFDLSLHGIESKPNLVKLMTQPPFLAATLCLLAAGALIAWQGFVRFGDPRVLPQDYSYGPASLAKTSAGFLASAKRLGSMGDAYAQLTRRQAIRQLGLSRQSTAAIDNSLTARETLRKISPKFEDLKHIPPTEDAMGFMARAKALAQWKKEMIREH